MTIAVANTSNTSTYFYWLSRTNELAHAMSTKVITVDSNATIGNSVLEGTFQANTVVADEIKANGSTLIISSNSVFSGSISVGNTTVNTSVNSTAITSGRVLIGGTITGNSTTLAVGANVVITSSLFSVGNSTINVSINSTSIAISGRSLPDTGPVNTNITSSAAIVDTFDIDTYRASEYVMSIVNNVSNGYQVSKMLVIGDGSDASITEFGVLSTNGQLGVFSANANSTTVKVYFTLASGITNVQIKGVRTPVPT